MAREPVTLVLEGLDGVGKSTVAALLAAQLDAVALRTPPAVLEPFRARFTAGAPDSSVRRTYYDLGNCLAGAEMAAARAAGRHAVCDRYHASTVAYVLGQRAGSDAELPPLGDAAYAWPADLPRPSHMVLLTLPEPERLARRAARTSVGETLEEAVLRQRAAVGARINEAYRRLGCVEVSAAGPPEAVAAAVLAAVGVPPGPAAGGACAGGGGAPPAAGGLTRGAGAAARPVA